MFFTGSRAGFLIKTNLETTIPSRVEEIRFKGCKLSLTVFFFFELYILLLRNVVFYILNVNFFQKFAACAYAVPWLNTEECLLSVLILDDFFQLSFSFIHQRFTVSNGVARVCFIE